VKDKYKKMKIMISTINSTKLILLLFVIFGISEITQAQTQADGCASSELSDRKLKKLPWYGNNELLYSILDSFNYAENNQQIFYRVPITLWVFSSNAKETLYKKLITEINYYNKLNNTGFEYYYSNIIEKRYTTPVKLGYGIGSFLKGSFYRKQGTVNILLVDDLIRKSLFKPKRYYKGQYNSATKAIILRVNSSPTSMTHEVGHFFGLHHPHRGWKRNKRHQESVSRERKAQRLFKEAKNCELNGDAICDTPAEPILIRYTNSECVYNGDLTDHWGDKYQPLTDNIMSYPNYMKCRVHFTEGQKAVMLYTAKAKNIKEWAANDTRFQFDTFEPNEELSNAQTIKLNDIYNNNLHLKFAGTNKKLKDNDIDWFLIEKDSLDTKKNKYQLHLSFENDNHSEVVLEISNSSNSPNVKIFNLIEKENLIDLDFTDNMNLYLKLFKENCDNQKINYTLSFSEN